MIYQPDPQIARTIAEKLLEIEAIKINLNQHYTWSSGWKSPIYCDNRLALSIPELRTYIKNELIRGINSAFPEVEGIAGVATAGIPQGAIIADQLSLPFLYVRSDAKSHGMQNKIEGKLTKGQKLVVIEDLISTGGSSLAAINALRDEKAEVLGLAAIFTYGFSDAEKAFGDNGVSYFTLSNYGYLLQAVKEKNLVTEDELNSLKSWRVDPANWFA